MAIELTDYLTANAFKALSLKAKELDMSIEGMLPLLKICYTDASLVFYYNDKCIFQRVNNVWFDAEMNELNLKGSVSTLHKAITLNKLRKAQKSTVLISFDK